MPQLESLPGEIPQPTRDELVEKYIRDYILVFPDVNPSDPTIQAKAKVHADSLLPLYASCRIVGSNCVLEDATGLAAVKQWAARIGVDGPNSATGATGFVEIECSSGGTFIPEDDLIIYEPLNLTYRTVNTRTYQDGDHCEIVGVDTGPTTNLDAGTRLKWDSPRPGCGPAADVVEQTDGAGLSGGSEAETTQEFKNRVLVESATKAASGNDADYQSTISKTPDIPIQQVFTYAGSNGTGTTTAVATVKPARTGGSRIPTPAQRSSMEIHCVGQMPADDGAFYPPIANENLDIVYGVKWDPDAVGWDDVVQWPPYYEIGGTPGGVVVSAAASATSFTLSASSYSGIVQPQAGQTIAFYDTAKFRFARKRILSFTGTGPWVITVDTSNDSSDSQFVPSVGRRAMPWSESLDVILPGVLEYCNGLGPGEIVASFYDEGRRQRRYPLAPKLWPHTTTDRGLEAAIDVSAILDRIVLEGSGVSPSVGSPGVLVNILLLRDVSVFPM